MATLRVEDQIAREAGEPQREPVAVDREGNDGGTIIK